MLAFFSNLILMEFQVRYLALYWILGIWPYIGIWFRVVLHGKCPQEYPFNAGVPQGSILGPTFFLLYINDLPDDIICNIAIYADDATVCSKCDQASELWQQLESASELESDLRDTVHWSKKWLVDFNACFV